MSRQDLDPLLRRLNVNGGRRDLVAFLEALSDDRFDRRIPDRVPEWTFGRWADPLTD